MSQPDSPCCRSFAAAELRKMAQSFDNTARGHWHPELSDTQQAYEESRNRCAARAAELEGAEDER